MFSLIFFCLILVKCDFDIFLFVDSVLYGFFFMYLELPSSDVFFLGSNENDSLLIQFFMDNTGEGNNPSRLPGSNAGSRLDINDIRLYDIDDLGNSNLEAEDDDRKPAAKDLTGRKRPATELNFEENSEISRPSFLLADNLDDLYVIGIE